MKMNKYLNTLWLVLFGLMTVGCAEEVSETEEEVQRRILEAYIKTTYGDMYQPTQSGMYIIPISTGYGDVVLFDSCYVLVQYEVRALNNAVLETSYESTAMEMGTYAPNAYYGRHLWKLGEDGVNDGLDELIRTIRVGGKSRGIIPPWLASDNDDANITVSGSESIIIYDIQLDSIIRDRQLYEINRLARYSYLNHNNLDSLKKGFYFQRIGEDRSHDTIPDNSKVHVRYVGRYLSGKVFDTNVADTAKRYRFNLDGKFETLDLTYRDSLEAMYEENEMVKGFVKAIHNMNYGERAITFFSSDWGYGSTSSAATGGVPAWEPLFFEIWVEDTSL